MHDALLQASRAAMTFNAPLSEERAGRLVEMLAIAPAHHVLDLGCGWGELLLRVVAAHPGTTGTGVDVDRAGLDRGRVLAAARGLADRVEFADGDATTSDDRGAVVLCVGASHAWGTSADALAALPEYVEPGGLLLYGDAFWQEPPTPRALEVIGELPAWGDLLEAAQATGFHVVSADRATQEEWDAFEVSSRAGLEASALEGSAERAAERWADYAEGYRGALGFAWLVLGR